MSRDLRVCHVITSLAGGGAQAMLLRLLERAPRLGIASSVVSLAGPAMLSRPCAGSGARLIHLPADPAAALRAIAGSDVVQTWLPHADLFGGLAARAAGRPVAWNLRNSNPGSFRVKRHTRAVIRACALASGRLPAAIICCAGTARAAYTAAGYAGDRMVTIPNGFDLARLRPDPTARTWLHGELALPEGAQVASMIARWDPQKDHHTLVKAAAVAARRLPGLHVVACGQGVDERNAELTGWRREAGLDGRLHLLGQRQDAARIMAGSDATILSSLLEGFPNVVAESMAVGTPCVATRAGEAPDIVGDTAPIVEPGDAQALGEALLAVLADDDRQRRERAGRCRQRIQERFSLDAISLAYARLWASLRSSP